MNMTSFDYGVSAVLLLFLLLGLWRGFVREVVSTLTWILGIVGGWYLATPAAPYFEFMTDSQGLQRACAFIAIFALVYLAGAILAYLLHGFISTSKALKLPNRILGGVVGLLRGGGLVVAVFLVAGLTPLPSQPFWREATLAPPFERAAIWVAGFLPPDIARHIRYG